MMKEEFEALVGKEVSIKDYNEIEYVYMWHPVIKDWGGKQMIADIYKAGGIIVIKDMMATAYRAQELEEKKAEIRKQIEELQKKQDELEHEFKEYLWER